MAPRQLFPAGMEDVDLVDVYDDRSRSPRADRPYLLANMVSSVDGGIALDGVTAALSSPADRRIFFLLRSLADVVLVGAQTVRTERYGPVRPDAAASARRAGRGQAPTARIAVVSASLDLDWSSRLFTQSETPPYVLAPSTADQARLRQAGAVARVVLAGEEGVDLRAALATLREEGVATVLCEGGPTLNHQLAAAGLVDELCLTLAPSLVGGGGPTILGASPLPGPVGLTLVSVLEEEGSLFLRYRLAASPRDDPARWA